jgi:hypothetical protein
VLATREDNNETWPSWELKYEDTKLPFTPVMGNVTVEIAESGPARVALRVTHDDGVSTYTQTVSLTAGGLRVEVDNEVEWHNRRTLLSAAFPLTVSNPVATFDIGLGAETLGNTDSYPYFQHCVHQWADMTAPDGSFGAAILNDCKYGMEKPTDDTLRLTLIHTPKAPFRGESAQDWQDHGLNLFKYGFTSHGDSRDGVALEAECLNNPLMAFSVDKHEGRAAALSFASVNDCEVAVRCVKEEQKGDRLVIRLQETAGRAHSGVRLTLAPHILRAVETNGYEEGNGNVEFDDHSLTFDMTPFAVKTFVLTVKNAADTADLGVPVALDYNKRVTTSRFDYTAGELGRGISIPEELFASTVECGGLRFALGQCGENNAMLCHGQTITLPMGTKKLVILAASTEGDREVTFTVGGRAASLRITDFAENIGCWDQVAAGDRAFIKRDPIAVSYSHTHSKEGDRLYQFAHIFAYTLNTEGADSVTLPVGGEIVLMAATAVMGEGKTAIPTAPLYDTVPEQKTPAHTLTAAGMRGTGLYHEGELIRVAAPRCGENGVFARFGGDAEIVWQEDIYALVRMGSRDAVIYPIYSNLGENVVLRKPCRACDCAGEEYRPENALNGDTVSKWMGRTGEDPTVETGASAWLEVDIGEITPIGKWLVQHCGEYEDRGNDTVDYFLQYKTAEEDPWQTADEVWGNIENMTLREFTPVQARFIRLLIIRPSHRPDPTCRIYQLHVYRADA